MNSENNLALITKHSKILTGGRFRTFECGDGWFDILDDMLSQIQAHVDSTPECPQVVAIQIKEKFGILRVYYSGGDESCRRIVHEAEGRSIITCDACGSPGRIDDECTVIAVRCSTHAHG